MPYPPFPLSFLPENVKKRIKDYAYNNPYADIKMPGSNMPGSAKNPMVSPYVGPPEYQDGFEMVPEDAIPLSRYKLQNIPKIDAKITDLQETPLPIVNPDYIKPEPLEYDPFTGLPIKKKFDQNSLPDLNTESPKVSLDISPYKDDVEYIRAQRQQEPEIKDDPEFRKKYNNALNFLAPSIKLMTGIGPNNFGDDGDASKLRSDYDGDISNVRSDYDGDISNVDPNKKNKFGVSEAYFLGKSMLDATALINNMVQPQPPSLQMKIPHYERLRLDPTPYDAMRSQMRDQGTQAYRLQRENISQASDLMKGLAAVTSGTQQGLMQVGIQQAGAQQQIDQMNQQISMQEQGQQTEMLNQEASTNYQIQQQAQQFKDQMVSAQLGNLGTTAGAYAQYVKSKEFAEKAENLSKYQTDAANAIQLGMLKYQAGVNELSSESYKEAEKSDMNQYINDERELLYNDVKYKDLKDKYQDDFDVYAIPSRLENHKYQRSRLDRLSKAYDGFAKEPEAPDYTKMTEEQKKLAENTYNQKLIAYRQDQTAYNNLKSQLDADQPYIDLQNDFYTELRGKYDTSKRRTEFQSSYLKNRNLPTIGELIVDIERQMKPNRQ
jgi:hypothetical protein